MKIFKKILILTLIAGIVLSVFLAFNSNTYATTAKDMMDKASGFINKGKTESNGVDIGSAVEPLAGFGSILTTVGVGILVIVTIIMGIRYITATPETQGKLKQQLIGLVVAGFVIFGSYSIWKLVVGIVKNL